MSPEQLEGKEVDARSDIFALGALLFEMATRQRAFRRDSQAGLIAAILTGDPPSISPQSAFDDRMRLAFDHVVKRCLAKNPDARWQTARDVKLELDWILQQGSAEPLSQVPEAGRQRARIGYAVVPSAIVAAVALVVTGTYRREAEPIQVTVSLPPGGVISPGETLTRLAVSPDGRRVAFVVSAEGHEQIWVRAFDSSAAQPIAGTEGANSPFWSPDSRFIGFFVPAEGQLKKVDILGGPPLTICPAEIDGLPAWNGDTILFTQLREGIHRVSEDGGTPVPVTRLDPAKRETNHYWPSFLPDGRRFFYMASARDSQGERVTPSVYVGSLDSDDVKLVAHLNSRMVYAPPGYALFVQDGVLLAQRFDTERLELVGEPGKVVDGLAYYWTLGSAGFSVSDTGVLAYHSGVPTSRLVWFDRDGHVDDLNWPAQRFGSLRFSPDGRAVAADLTDPRTGTKDIWTFDLTRGIPMRLTDEATNESDPLWSPDGGRILFRSDRRGAPSLFVKAPGVSEQERQMLRSGSPLSPEDWSGDGRWIAYVDSNRQRGSRLWILPVSADNPKPRPFEDTRFAESGARFSPDSQWVAFVSEESGTSEVYVAPLSGSMARRRISTGGGVAPRWGRDGRELFYASADNTSIMAVPVTLKPTFQAGIPARLFTIGTGAGYSRRARNMAFDVAPDGQRFLVSVPVDPTAASLVSVVFNWSARLP
jgi:Tol biopolymer transport system component